MTDKQQQKSIVFVLLLLQNNEKIEFAWAHPKNGISHNKI